MCLRAQADLGLTQPNLSIRIHSNSPDEFLQAAAFVISKGSGMPQVFNDEVIMPGQINRGVAPEDALNYAVVGCVELSTPGKALGWSDAAMFNLTRILELTLFGGKRPADRRADRAGDADAGRDARFRRAGGGLRPPACSFRASHGERLQHRRQHPRRDAAFAFPFAGHPGLCGARSWMSQPAAPITTSPACKGCRSPTWPIAWRQCARPCSTSVG